MSVYWAVRTGPSNTNRLNLPLTNSMAQYRHRPLTAQPRVNSAVIFVVDEVELPLASSTSCLLFPVSITPPLLHTHSHIIVALTRKTKSRILETLKKEWSSEIGQ